MMTHVEIPVDESVLLSLREDRQSFVRTLQVNAALSLYRKRRLSLGKAAQLAGYDRIGFIRKLQDEGEPIFDYEEDMVREMVESAATVDAMLRAEGEKK